MSNTALPFGVSGLAADETDAFVDGLAELPFSRWPAPTTSAGHATAAALLDAVLADRRLAVTAWYVRDLVETSAHLAGCDARGARACERDRRRACELAELAALALLVRPLLPAGDFGALYAPFAFVLPRHRLRDDWSRRAGGAQNDAWSAATRG